MELLNSFSLKSPDLKKNHLSESSYVLDAAFAYEGSVTNGTYVYHMVSHFYGFSSFIDIPQSTNSNSFSSVLDFV